MEEILDHGLAKGLDGSSSSETLERAWVIASQRGDAAAFNRLVLAWESRVYNLALRMLHDADEAAEMTQEVFLRAYRNIRRFRGEARFSTWLYRIASNRCLSRLRQRPHASHPSLDSDSFPGRLEPASSESPETVFLQAERGRQAARALHDLGVDQRMVVELKIFQDQTFDEIAAIVDVPASTVKSRFYTGLEILKQRLGDANAEEMKP